MTDTDATTPGDEPTEEAPDTDPAEESPAADTTDVPHELEARPNGGMRPPEPPRRTGVFVHADDLREYVGGLLRSMLGGYEADAFGNFTFVHEDARIFITVGPSPVGPHVGVFSVTNVDVDLTPDLAAFLLTTNHQLGFGAFSYDHENRAVWLRHTLLGTTLDAPELHTAVAAVANTAHQANKAITQQFNGGSFPTADPPTEDTPRPPRATTDPDLTNPTGYL